MEITKSEAEVIIKLAAKLINAIDKEMKEKEILRSTEDGHDIDELANAQSEEINLRGGLANCEDCND
tara:strand:- start:5449 stop:5649 length:201 start_codon:yes stop_codon:yes gene_type:complete